MALLLLSAQGPGVGIRFGTQDAIMTLDTGLTCARGDCLAVDMDTVNAAGDRYIVRAPATADFTQASGAYLPTFFCIALETKTVAASDVMVRFVGPVEALADDTDSAATGKFLIPKNAARGLDALATAVGGGNRTVAIARAATVAASLSMVDFDGIHGFGQALTNTT